MNFKSWIPACAGMTMAFAALGADSLPGAKPGAQPDFLPVDDAFQLQPLEGRKDGKLETGWRIAKGYYLYRDRLKFTLTAPASARLGAAELPAGEKHEDEHFGTVIVYRGDLDVLLPVDAKKGPYTLTVQYQGCADAGLCYPPQTRTLELKR